MCELFRRSGYDRSVRNIPLRAAGQDRVTTTTFGTVRSKRRWNLSTSTAPHDQRCKANRWAKPPPAPETQLISNAQGERRLTDTLQAALSSLFWLLWAESLTGIVVFRSIFSRRAPLSLPPSIPYRPEELANRNIGCRRTSVFI